MSKYHKSIKMAKSGLRTHQDAFLKASRMFKGQKFVQLDAGCGENAQKGWYRMDMRPLPGIDFIHDCEVLPWPFPPSSIDRILMSHVIEHLNPKIMINLINEIWRIMKSGGQLLLSMPYANSFGFWQDPTHIHTWNEATATYFCPSQPLWNVYKPHPWKIIKNDYVMNGNIEIILEKVGELEKIS